MACPRLSTHLPLNFLPSSSSDPWNSSAAFQPFCHIKARIYKLLSGKGQALCYHHDSNTSLSQGAFIAIVLSCSTGFLSPLTLPHQCPCRSNRWRWVPEDTSGESGTKDCCPHLTTLSPLFAHFGLLRPEVTEGSPSRTHCKQMRPPVLLRKLVR